jgi:hypothetical protein
MNTKKRLKAIISKPLAPKRILIIFKLNKEGKPVTEIKMDKDINANHAATTMEQLATSIAQGIRKKAHGLGLEQVDEAQKDFIMQQTIGDIM